MKIMLEITLDELIDCFANKFNTALLAHCISEGHNESVKAWCLCCERGSLDLVKAVQEVKNGQDSLLRSFVEQYFNDCIPVCYKSKKDLEQLMITSDVINIYFTKEDLVKIP
jgi:hypothetical protein